MVDPERLVPVRPFVADVIDDILHCFCPPALALAWKPTLLAKHLADADPARTGRQALVEEAVVVETSTPMGDEKVRGQVRILHLACSKLPFFFYSKTMGCLLGWACAWPSSLG